VAPSLSSCLSEVRADGGALFHVHDLVPPTTAADRDLYSSLAPQVILTPMACVAVAIRLCLCRSAESRTCVCVDVVAGLVTAGGDTAGVDVERRAGWRRVRATDRPTLVHGKVLWNVLLPLVGACKRTRAATVAVLAAPYVTVELFYVPRDRVWAWRSCTGPPRRWRPYRKSSLTAARGSSHRCGGMQPGPKRRDSWISPCALPFVGGGFSTVGNYCSRLSVLRAEWIWALCSVDTHDAVFAPLKHVFPTHGKTQDQ